MERQAKRVNELQQETEKTINSLKDQSARLTALDANATATTQQLIRTRESLKPMAVALTELAWETVFNRPISPTATEQELKSQNNFRESTVSVLEFAFPDPKIREQWLRDHGVR